MKKYYAVRLRICDNGYVAIDLVDTIEAEEKPEDTYISLKHDDIYVTWFDSYDKAMDYIEHCQKSYDY